MTRPSAFVWRGALLAVFVFLDLMFLKHNVAGGDWAPVWVAGRLAVSEPSLIYQFDLVSTLQHPLVGDLGQRPFIYPPTVLLLTVPFSFMPFHLSLLLFSSVALALTVWAARSWTNERWLLIAMLPVFAAAYSGQLTLIVAALILFSMAKLDTRPVIAGLLLGLAAVLKPQLLVLAPVALIAGRHWRTIFAATATAVIVIAVTTGAFGIDLWRLWIGSLGPFQALIAAHGPLLRNAITPFAAALRMGVDPRAIIIVLVLITITAVVFFFSQTRDPRAQLVALVGGGLLISPYAMNYELVALAPLTLVRSFPRIASVAMPLVVSLSMAFTASLAGLVIVYVWTLTASLLRPRFATCRSGSGPSTHAQEE